jgi:hypothetical protein
VQIQVTCEAGTDYVGMDILSDGQVACALWRADGIWRQSHGRIDTVVTEVLICDDWRMELCPAGKMVAELHGIDRERTIHIAEPIIPLGASRVTAVYGY